MNNAGVQGGRVRATMRAIAVRGPVGALLCATVFGAPVPARADVVAYFGGIASNTINAPANPPATPQENRPVLAVDMAAVHVAMYDAIVAIEGGYEPFAVIPNSPAAGASPEAAAATAACAVLGAFFPSRSAYYSDACSGYLNGLPADAATAMGKTLGKEVADAVVSLRADDGRSVAFNYLPGSGPGDSGPIPPTRSLRAGSSPT